MRLITLEEHEKLSRYMTSRMGELAFHEDKNIWIGSVDRQFCMVNLFENNVKVYRVYTHAFLRIIRQEYPRALSNCRFYFGTGKAQDVISALYKESDATSWKWDIIRYINYLKNEVFCLLIKEDNGIFSEDILRVDLFRKVEMNKKKPQFWEFTGGIFHVLKHFSCNDIPLSTNQEHCNIYDIEHLIWLLINGFFIQNRIPSKPDNNNKSESIVYVDNLKCKIKFGFYTEQTTNISFVNTAHKI